MRPLVSSSAGSVIKGWDVGVATMKKGEKAILTCSAEYAYGSRGSPPKIPGGATLNFEVQDSPIEVVSENLSSKWREMPQHSTCTRISLLLFADSRMWNVCQVELLSWKSDNDVSGDGGVMKYVESEGAGWETPNDIDELTGDVWFSRTDPFCYEQ